MLQSMTGFGRVEGIFSNKKISVDIKSLNSKNLDLNLRLPFIYKEKEFDYRKKISEIAQRGKIDCFISIENIETSNVKINKELINTYISELKEITDSAPDFEYLKMAIRLPESISSKNEEIPDEEWLFLENLITEALTNFKNFRQTEGEILQKELQKNIRNIENNLSKVENYEKERISSIKERYKKALDEFNNIDETRFYQEIIFYTEKLDISEEKVRLAQHIKYYQSVMNSEPFCGKKLGFIAQEMGREINTLGSKSNHSEIQKLVVEMKDDLEKIKEQTLNIL